MIGEARFEGTGTMINIWCLAGLGEKNLLKCKHVFSAHHTESSTFTHHHYYNSYHILISFIR